MNGWHILALLMAILLVPLTVDAAPAGKIVIAQGVDPTTLDTMNPAHVSGMDKAKTNAKAFAREVITRLKSLEGQAQMHAVGEA